MTPQKINKIYPIDNRLVYEDNFRIYSKGAAGRVVNSALTIYEFGHKGVCFIETSIKCTP